MLYILLMTLQALYFLLFSITRFLAHFSAKQDEIGPTATKEKMKVLAKQYETVRIETYRLKGYLA